MAYQRFKIAETQVPPATFATSATLPAKTPRSVANVASVADRHLETALQTVASVASVAEARRVSGDQGPLRKFAVSEPAAQQPGDADLYAEALRQHAPAGYGVIGITLGWGMTRAANAETVLREAGRIKYDHTGRGVLVDGPIPSQATGEKSWSR